MGNNVNNCLSFYVKEISQIINQFNNLKKIFLHELFFVEGANNFLYEKMIAKNIKNHLHYEHQNTFSEYLIIRMADFLCSRLVGWL